MFETVTQRKLFCRCFFGCFAAAELLCELVESDGKAGDGAHHAAQHTGDENLSGGQISESLNALSIGKPEVLITALDGAFFELFD